MNFHTTLSTKKYIHSKERRDIYLRKTPDKSLISPPIVYYVPKEKKPNHFLVYFTDKIVVAKSTDINVEHVCYVIS